MFKYKIIKKAIGYELANFCFNYFKMKREVTAYYITKNVELERIVPKPTGKYVSMRELFATKFMGTWSDPDVPNTYSHYSDIVMETLLIKLIPLMKKETQLKLVPTYSYARMYKPGDVLERHKDRPSCEISCTMHLGGDQWPIYIAQSERRGTKGKKVLLDKGDLLIYSGCKLEHWREPFEGDLCAQVFLHYNHENGPFASENRFDKRPMLGLSYHTRSTFDK
tara:strand:- start:576 stop:1244 length:669 start_codon:yes stop_codon:yes gene_type:complete